MKNSLVICALALITLSSCAGMSEDWKAKNCNYNTAYEKGNNDRENGEEMDSKVFAYNCEDHSKDETLKGYRDGYEKARQQEQQPAKNGASINIGGTHINIGGTNKKAFYCRVEAFGHKYDGFGPTKIEAKKAAQVECTKDNNEMHCQTARCVINK